MRDPPFIQTFNFDYVILNLISKDLDIDYDNNEALNRRV